MSGSDAVANRDNDPLGPLLYELAQDGFQTRAVPEMGEDPSVYLDAGLLRKTPPRLPGVDEPTLVRTLTRQSDIPPDSWRYGVLISDMSSSLPSFCGFSQVSAGE